MLPLYLRDRDHRSRPALLAAAMDGLTHSALRRLLADFGGYDALSTEMIPARRVTGENVRVWTRTRRRPEEGAVVYQLLVNNAEEIAPALDRLSVLAPDVIELNLGCPAPAVRRRGAGAALWNDTERLRQILSELRRRWNGPLSVKCRLGHQCPTWRETFTQRLQLFEECGVDILVVHPRFTDDKLKRRVRWDEVPWIASHTRLSLIGNGDIDSVERLEHLSRTVPCVHGFMLGRIAAVQPWIFARATGRPLSIDYAEVWKRFVEYVREDFPPEKVLGRVKMFTEYYARNFRFGHELFRAVHSADSLEEAWDSALRFLESAPEPCRVPSLSGL